MPERKIGRVTFFQPEKRLFTVHDSYYDQINENAISILEDIESLDHNTHVKEYEWLCANLRSDPRPADYRRRYIVYWRMNAARLCSTFYEAYFEQLELALSHASPLSAVAIAETLYKVPTRYDGSKSLQFSLTTKLCHMVDRNLPIVDSMVSKFYHFKLPAPLDGQWNFYNFLQQEYQRIIEEGILARAIAAFKAKYTTQYFTDTKIIDGSPATTPIFSFADREGAPGAGQAQAWHTR